MLGMRKTVQCSTRMYRGYATSKTTGQLTVWSKILEQKRLVKPAILLILFGSAAVNFNKEKKKLDEIELKFGKKLEILTDIRSDLRDNKPVNLNENLKLINKSFEYLGYGGTYFKGHVEKKQIDTEADEDLSSILKEFNDPHFLKQKTDDSIPETRKLAISEVVIPLKDITSAEKSLNHSSDGQLTVSKDKLKDFI